MDRLCASLAGEALTQELEETVHRRQRLVFGHGADPADELGHGGGARRRGLGKQNGFLPSGVAEFDVDAPCAKPWQKLILASPSASLGLAPQSSARSPAVRA